MKHSLTFGALSLAAVLAAGPTMAQSTNHATSTAPATGYTGNTAPNDRNPVMTQTGEARASKVVGSSVYNDRDQKVGSIDDLVIDKQGHINAILSVGGFLGMGSKYVEVPYANLTFGNTQRDSDNRVVMKGATKESLQSTPGYNYYKS